MKRGSPPVHTHWHNRNSQLQRSQSRRKEWSRDSSFLLTHWRNAANAAPNSPRFAPTLQHLHCQPPLPIPFAPPQSFFKVSRPSSIENSRSRTWKVLCCSLSPVPSSFWSLRGERATRAKMLTGGASERDGRGKEKDWGGEQTRRSCRLPLVVFLYGGCAESERERKEWERTWGVGESLGSGGPMAPTGVRVRAKGVWLVSLARSHSNEACAFCCCLFCESGLEWWSWVYGGDQESEFPGFPGLRFIYGPRLFGQHLIPRVLLEFAKNTHTQAQEFGPTGKHWHR